MGKRFTELLTKAGFLGGKIMITDLRRIWLALFMKKFRTVFTLDEAVEVIEPSKIRKGKAFQGFFWWDYMVGIVEQHSKQR